ncbi:N-formylglutamate amidohydrolase [Acuticoccus sp. M5D2P5]|uniref:N-formylglutamate amidohydrolase n=1 Tax=Acuticoccus kalidii TaxID=2910977 RepID=UPI001F4547A2|nr:N-formylglutamate amidohydrolase [Acuticoccus kalidii]MCF3936376.1 N-formylglutamate amidohydrolase [Acuticoccus kalidii]
MPLAAVSPTVVDVINEDGRGDVVLVCEHASNFMPAEFGGLGLSDDERRAHIAWDPGALPVARTLSETFDAPLVAARVSRLVYDCNRPPEAESAIPAQSEIFAIPGNQDLSEAARADRAARYYKPFRETVCNLLDRREASGRRSVLVTIHSFTAVYFGVRRELDVGIIHDTDRRLADPLLAACRNAGPMTVCLNEPYGPEDGVTHTLREHALPRGLLNAMIEIRNDLIADDDGVALWAGRLADAFTDAIPQALARPA